MTAICVTTRSLPSIGGRAACPDFAHVAGRLFNVERGLAIDVPLGAVDFVELLQDGVLETELWYDFLNLGFKLIPTAGSDFPYYSASRAPSATTFSSATTSRLTPITKPSRTAATFVTNGPMLEFTVNGAADGLRDIVVSRRR